mmetsp:Transcript_2121/g.4917  ORF Transcript_2121/g.4917 Transcript_2121/m.4917 type:complete len:111 (+) Transcript_2121:714-1046(+)
MMMATKRSVAWLVSKKQLKPSRLALVPINSTTSSIFVEGLRNAARPAGRFSRLFVMSNTAETDARTSASASQNRLVVPDLWGEAAAFIILLQANNHSRFWKLKSITKECT